MRATALFPPPRPGFAAPLIVAVAALLASIAAAAAPASKLSVRLVTGSQELAAGSTVELRLYEISGRVRRLPLTHGEFWSRDSTRVIPLDLSEPLDPRTVKRFSIYYRAASASAGPWEIAAADVVVEQGRDAGKHLLGATLRGAIAREGELASPELEREALACASDADCDDGRSCNGRERCAPRTPGADARGCVKGTPVVCPVNQICSEGHGCVGVEPLHTAPPTPANP